MSSLASDVQLVNKFPGNYYNESANLISIRLSLYIYCTFSPERSLIETRVHAVNYRLLRYLLVSRLSVDAQIKAGTNWVG